MKRILSFLVLLPLLGGAVFCQAAEHQRLPPKDQFHLFLLVGQSNMAGRGIFSEEDRTAHPRVLMLNKEGEWVPAVDPMHFDKPIAGVGLGKTFGQIIADVNPDVTIGLIPCAVGGSPIDSWQPGAFYNPTKSHPWDDAMERAKLALQSGELKGILWHQGESDSNARLASAYEVKLDDLINRLRSELNAANAPFIAGQMGRFADNPWDEFKERVNAAHEGLPSRMPNTAFVASDGLQHKGDKIHFDSASYRELGRRYAAAYQQLTVETAANIRRGQRPRLQFINGSSQPIEVFWRESESERVSNGTIRPGRNKIIDTTIGHEFVMVGKEDGFEQRVTSVVPIQAVRFDPPDTSGIPDYYTQRASANGFPIVASERVNPYALKEAVYLVDLMLARRPDVRKAMIQSGARLCIIAHNEFTTDHPEFVWLGRRPMRSFPNLSGRDYWDARARGLGGSQTDPFCSCAEENLLGYPGDPYAAENILIHEFAHNMHLRGLANVDPTFDPRLKDTYDAAMEQGLWKGKYASVNHHEYFAEGVQSWFDDNREYDHDHNHVNTRVELIEYDPGLAAICREVFGDTELRYTKPATRLTGHMEGYDPGGAPTFVWPDRLQEAKKDIRAAAAARDQAANAR